MRAFLMLHGKTKRFMMSKEDEYLEVSWQLRMSGIKQSIDEFVESVIKDAKDIDKYYKMRRLEHYYDKAKDWQRLANEGHMSIHDINLFGDEYNIQIPEKYKRNNS